MSSSGKITVVTVDEASLVSHSAELAEERKIAEYELVEESTFDVANEQLRPESGNYALSLGRFENRLILTVQAANGTAIDESASQQFQLSLTPLRKPIREYKQLCGRYYHAIRHEPAARIEAIDMARRGLHNEAGQILIDRLEGKLELDHETARRLVTIICGYVEDQDDV